MKSEKVKGTKKSYRLYIFAAFLAVIMALSCVAIVALDNNDASATTSTYNSSTKTLVLGTDITVIDETRDINPGSAYYVNNNGAVTLTMRATPAPTMETPVVVFINSEGPKVTFVNEYVSDFNNADPDTNFDHAAVFVVYIVDSHDGTTSITLANGLKSANLDGDNFIVGEAIYGSTNAGDARVTCRNPETMSFTAYNGHVYYAGDFDTEAQESYFCGEGDVQLFGPFVGNAYPSTDLCNVNFYDKTGTFKGDAHWEEGPGANQAYDIFDLESFTGSFSQINRIVTIESWVGGDLNITKAPEAYKVVLKAGLIIPAGSTLTVGDGTFVDAAGAVTNNGRIVNNGTISNSANISGNAVMTPSTYAGKTLTLSNDIEVVTATQTVLPGGAYYVNNSTEVTLTVGATPVPSMDAPVIIFINKEAPLVTLVNEYVSDFNNVHPETNFKHATVFVIYMVDSHEGVTSITLVNGLKADNLDDDKFKVGTAVYGVDDVGDGTTTARNAHTSSYRVYNGVLYRAGNFSNEGLVGYYCGESNVQQFGPFVGNAYPSTELSTSNFYEMTGTFKGDAHWEEGPGANQAYDIFSLENFTGTLTQINRVVTIDTWTGGDITITKGAEGYAVILKADLTIPAGSTLTVNEGVYADAKATVTNNGTIVNHGTIANPENITGNPVVSASTYDAGDKTITLAGDIQVVAGNAVNAVPGNAYYLTYTGNEDITVTIGSSPVPTMDAPVILFINADKRVNVVVEYDSPFDGNHPENNYEKATCIAVYLVAEYNSTTGVITLANGLKADNLDGDYFKVGEMYWVDEWTPAAVASEHSKATSGDSRTWVRSPSTRSFYGSIINAEGIVLTGGNSNNTAAENYFRGSGIIQNYYEAGEATLHFVEFTGSLLGDAHFEDPVTDVSYTELTLTSFTGVVKILNRVVTIDEWTAGDIEIEKADSTHGVILDTTVPGGSTITSVAKIGDVYYGTLDDAVAAVEDGQTIALLQNIEYVGAALVIGDSSGTTTSKDNFSVTIDLNGKTVNFHQDGFKVYNATLTLSGNGAVNCGVGQVSDEWLCVWAQSGSVINIQGGSYTSTTMYDSCIYAMEGGVINISGGEFTAQGASSACGYLLNVKNDSATSRINVTGGIFNGYDPKIGDDTKAGGITQSDFTANGYTSVETSAEVYEIVEAFTVTIVSNNDSWGTVDESSVTKVPSGSKITVADNTITVNGVLITATPDSGDAQYEYTFYGWSVVDQTEVTSDMTVTATFSQSIRQYTVTLDLDGGALANVPTGWSFDTVYTKSFAYGTAYADIIASIVYDDSPIAPTKDGYRFSAWDPSTGTLSDIATLTATYVQTFTVTLAAGDEGITGFQYKIGTGEFINYTAPVEVDYGTTVTVKAILADGYTFVQWAAGITDNPYEIASVTAAVNYTATSTNAVVTYNAYVNANNGTTDKSDAMEINPATMPTVTLPAASAFSQWTKTGYHMVGYSTTATGAKELDFGQSVPVADVIAIADANNNVNIYVVWEIDTFEVTIVPNNPSYGGVSVGSIAAVPYDSVISVNGNKLTINGNEVTANPMDETVQYMYSFVSWSVNDGYKVTSDLVITATFAQTVKKYSVTLDLGIGGKFASTPAGFEKASEEAYIGWFDYGTEVNVTEIPTKDPTAEFVYTFSHWNVAFPITVTESSMTIALYDEATREYTVSFSVDGNGTVAPASVANVPYGSAFTVSDNTVTIIGTTVTVTVGADVEKYTYSFGGWNIKNGDTVAGDTAVVATVVEITKPETTETAVEFISDSDDKTVTASVDDIKSSDKENVVIGKDVESTSDAANWSVEIPKSYFSDKTENVSVTVTDVSADLPDVISDDQKKKLEGMTVISLDMIIGEKTEHQFGTKVTVKLAYTLKAGQSADNLFVYYVNTENGDIEKYDAIYADGFITFETDHFSFWAVGEDNGSSSPVNDGLFLASLLVAAIILPIIAGLVIFRKK